MLSALYDTIYSTVATAAAGATPRFGLHVELGHVEGPLIVVVVGSLLCVVMPLELSQLVFMVIGATTYALLQSLQPAKRPSGGAGKAKGAKLVDRPPVGAAGKPCMPVSRSPSSAMCGASPKVRSPA
eukprot:CAMPEP_0204522702 /NCGR_PEP_ID=MMETSP0661-20131031/6463_1 /ASSEMBLY_ACC=CAM_ASM_000606 /TAXON_ID=109239 /ORGANISM="Alexandrium margalefi, Strain AMGDE01CS-322" /LENGTH=126 /DNA_ID=CAMNT_0051528381 /DNA_START=60 /DNA_END=437 /DNA_ORIENTATION=+